MRVGFDIHGIIDREPKFFSLLSNRLVKGGHEVHMLTGQEFKHVKDDLYNWGIRYTHHFSILDNCAACGVKISVREGNKWVDDLTWNSAKGVYAGEVGLGVHFDNDLVYGEYFPKSCYFVHLSKDMDILVGMKKVHEIISFFLDSSGKQ